MHHVVVHFLLTLKGLQITSLTFSVQKKLLKFKENLGVILCTEHISRMVRSCNFIYLYLFICIGCMEDK